MNFPLQDINFVVTRDPGQSGNLIKKITALGGKVFSFPTISISPPSDWTACDNALRRIEEFQWIIFTSVNGVRYFMDRAREHHRIQHFGASFAAVGRKTAEVLQEYNIPADLVPESYSAEGLLDRFEKLNIKDQIILIPTSSRAGNELPAGLQKLGAVVEKVISYRNEYPDPAAADRAIRPMLERKMDCYMFYSPSSFKSMLKMMGNEKIQEILQGHTALAAIGPSTARVIREHGYEVQIQPEKSLDESMIEAIVAYFNKKN
jgi:uroporphyrinogen III methyltransferase / synthase